MGFKRKRTVAYNPQANGFIERWHRTLKAAIMCHGRPDWTRILPTVLLGLRTAFREDSEYTAAEMVYGETIRLPGDFINASISTSTNQTELIKELREHFKIIKPVPPAHHNKSNPFIFKELGRCSHVFIRNDSVRAPLQPPYEGPFQVLGRQEKYFKIQVKNREVNVSVDRLKPCFQEATQESEAANERLSAIPQPSQTVQILPQIPDGQVSRSERKVTINPIPEVKIIPRNTRAGE